MKSGLGRIVGRSAVDSHGWYLVGVSSLPLLIASCGFMRARMNPLALMSKMIEADDDLKTNGRHQSECNLPDKIPFLIPGQDSRSTFTPQKARRCGCYIPSWLVYCMEGKKYLEVEEKVFRLDKEAN